MLFLATINELCINCQNIQKILDSRDLEVFGVEEASSKTKLSFELTKGNEFGQALQISLAKLTNISELK